MCRIFITVASAEF